MRTTETTVPKQLKPWKPGQSGNPAGRPKGSRNKLSELFIADLYADWREHGRRAIEQVRENRPHDYLKVVAAILPRDVSLRHDATSAFAALVEAISSGTFDAVADASQH